ncbi:AAA family ATPase [Legionella steelei]|uniref:AAA family ATPase n=1 Tax=Legionella steelei TaxID=947033 RepID=UPI001AC4EFDE|nr:AAA family ATPase [Legionella steelei]MBN9228022.1 AAA family ATPase [Legionella steelei]
MNKLEQANRFIFTGTPGSGKTSVILALKRLGYAVIPESATDVIAKEQAKGTVSPWEQTDFVDKIVLTQKLRQLNAHGALQFYDRSPFCAYALGRYSAHWHHRDFAPSPVLLEEVDRCLKAGIYQRKVFFFENLGFIEPTSARKIRYEDALIFEQIHIDVYKEFGFEIVLVPKKTITERCEFVLETLGIKK